MAVTLAMVQQGLTDKLNRAVVDNFRRSNYLMEQLTFEEGVVGTLNSTLTFSWQFLLTPSGAAFRGLYQEYTDSEATYDKASVDLQILGGSFSIDRVLIAADNREQVRLQLDQKNKAVQNLFVDMAINGVATQASNAGTGIKRRAASPLQAGGFDGLSKWLEGSPTEINPGTVGTNGVAAIDLTAVNSQQTSIAFQNQIDAMIGEMDDVPDALIMNRTALRAFKAAAKYGVALPTIDGFGGKIQSYDGIALIDAGYVYATNGAATPVVRQASGLTSIYGVKFGLDGFHGVTLVGASGGDSTQRLLKTYKTPDDSDGVNRRFEVEMVAAPALASQRKAGVIRNVKVA